MISPKIKKEFKDRRGTIFTFFVDGNERLLTFTKEGFSRGGHSHFEVQSTFVLSGEVKWREWVGDHDVEVFLYEGDMKYTESQVPHLLTAMTDCWIIETRRPLNTRASRAMAKVYRRVVEGERYE
jgi:mannose-6-phosphate isomerase-like protein (cupin superfamily)